jgi:transposase
MYYCGIDVSKYKHVALFMDAHSQVTKPAFTITNDRCGFDRLLGELVGLAEPVTVGLEATGHYWLALYELLTAHDYPVVVLNPLQVHAYQRTDLRKCKNDRIDAYWIADFLRVAHCAPADERTEVWLQLRELSRFRQRLSAQIGECKQKILNVLERVFPEYEQLFSDVFLTSSRRLLAEAVTAQEFAEFDLAELTQVLQTSSRGRFGAAKAQTIQQAAQHSVGISFLTDAVRIEMRCLLNQLELLETQRQDIDTALAQLMAQLPQYITSIPGIGLATGAAILAEIGDIQRFDSVEKLVAYAGIDATVYQSGQFAATHTHMSKRGSPYLRQALWQAATVAIQSDPELKAFYARKRGEGKAHGTALGAICRKLLARIFVVLKEQRPYIVR